MGGTTTRSMVGRESEQAALAAELRNVRAGTLRCVLIEGEAGMGKTRLVTEFLAGKERSAVVLRARGYAFGTGTPYGLWAEALDSHLRRLPGEMVRELCAGAEGDLDGIVHAVTAAVFASRRDPSGRAAGAASARRPLEGIVRLLENLSTARPVIVCLDDLHLADASSSGALDYVAHNLAHAPILVVACARPGEFAGQMVARETLFRLEQEGVLRRFLLRPLDDRALRRLAEAAVPAQPVPDSLIAWLLDRSRGNPLFATGLIEALVDQGANLAAPELSSVPARLGERVLASVAHLDATARDVLQLLAVVGHETEVHELRRYTHGSRDDIDSGLAVLLAAGLIAAEEHPGGVRYQIVHPLVQDAIYQNIVIPRRRTLHRAIARSLVASDRLGEAAPHLVRSAEAADAEALDALMRAVRHAWALGAFTEALEIMSALLELLGPGDRRARDVLNVMTLEGEWLFHHKTDVDYALCIRVLRKADRLAESSIDARGRATLNMHLASFLAWGDGDLGEAVRRGEAAVELFEAVGDDQRALLARNELAWIRGITGDLDAQEEAARTLLADAQNGGDRGATLMALGNVASTLWPRGRLQEAAALYGSCIEMARADDNGPRLRHAHTLLAMTHALGGRLDDARGALGAAAEADPDAADALILEFGPHITWFTGDMPGTLAGARVALARVGPRRLTIVPMIGALAASEMAATDTARSLLASAAETVAQRRRWIIGTYFRWATGLHAWFAGDVRRSLDELERASSSLLDIGAGAVAMLVLIDLVGVAVDTDIGAARRALDRLDTIADGRGSGLVDSLAAMAHAEVALAMEDSVTAAACAQEAALVFEHGGYRLLAGRALHTLGRSLAAIDRDTAVASARRAAALFLECGAAVRQARSQELLRTLGKPGRRAAAEVLREPLSRREHDVVTLAVQGLSAREIGDRLYISERTVESHLANAYAKLGVHTRVELVRIRQRVQ